MGKYIKVNDFKIKVFIQLDKFPILIFGSETNVEKLMDFVLTLPEKIQNVETKSTLLNIHL